jgi:hypothetical protein
VSPVRIDLARSPVGGLGSSRSTSERAPASCGAEGPSRLAWCRVAEGDVRFRYGIGALRRAGKRDHDLGGEGDDWPGDDATVRDDFEREYRRIYGLTIPDVGVEIVTWRGRPSRTDTVEPAVPEGVAHAPSEAVPHRRRPVVYHRANRRSTSTSIDETLGIGARFEGPAIVEERETTAVIRPGWSVEVATDGSLIATRHTPRPRRSCMMTHVRPHRARGAVAVADRNGQRAGKALQRAAFSPIVREAGDLANALFDREGRMVAQAVTGTPGHINSLARAATAILESTPSRSSSRATSSSPTIPTRRPGSLDVTVFSPVWRNSGGASR